MCKAARGHFQLDSTCCHQWVVIDDICRHVHALRDLFKRPALLSRSTCEYRGTRGSAVASAALRRFIFFSCSYRAEAQASPGGGDPEGQGCQAEPGVAGPEARTVQMPASIPGYELSVAWHLKFRTSLANIRLHKRLCLFSPAAEDMTN